MELSGAWRAVEADETRRRTFPDPDADDDSWATVDVPGHWRSHRVFAATDGPLLYRRRFAAAAPSVGRRTWLTLDGLFYQGDVWFDGTHLGGTEGYFFPNTFEARARRRRTATALVAARAGRAAPVRRRRRRHPAGRRPQPSPHHPHRAPSGGHEAMDRHGQRRAAVPQGVQPGADPHGPGRGHAGRD